MSTRHKSGRATSRIKPSTPAPEDCRAPKPATAVLLLAVGTFVKLRRRPRIGEVSERLKELASKASVGESQPWVRIPPSPPLHSFYEPRRFQPTSSPLQRGGWNHRVILGENRR